MTKDDIGMVVRDGLSSTMLMQIATVGDSGPWICTVYFVVDEDLNLYWLSWPSRRHSQEITQSSKVAVAIAVKHDIPVVGIQAEGCAEVVEDVAVIKDVMEKYTTKFGIGSKFYDNFVAGNNQHRMYKFTPEYMTLFDEVNFKDSSPIVFISKSVATNC